MSLHVHCTAFYSPATEALINNNNNIDKHTQTGPRVTRALLRLVWQFDGIVQKHTHKRLILTLKCSFDYPEHKIINSHSQF